MFLFGRCYNDREGLLYPPGTSTCDTSAASTFSATVLPILATNCNTCHGGAAVSGMGINLDTYNGVITQVNSGKLMGDITHAAGYNAMPLGGGKLSDCNIAKIQRWINAGKTNN